MGEDRLLNAPERFEIRSSERGARLVLRRYRGRLLAEFEAPEVSAAIEVHLLGGCDGFDQFWRGLAEDWRGWEGTRFWGSLEGELVLSATSDRLGHVSLEVRLREGHPLRWHLEGVLRLEGGLLGSIAKKARAFCGLFGAIA